MKATKLTVKTKTKNYPIYIGNNILNSTGILIKKNIPGVKKICIVADKKIPNEFKKKLSSSLRNFNLEILVLNVSEKIKNLEVANKIIEILLKKNFNRTDCLIAFGGGIIGDLTSFAASLTKRGIKFVNVPTTLLSQVDSSIGGKTGINSSMGKNLIGTFYQPEFVLTDISVINKLPYREMICGYGEILKHSLISNKKLFSWLSKNAEKIIFLKNKKIMKQAIIESCKIKSKIIEKDVTENSLRMILNFGHTFAHGFEAAKNYSKNLNHGEAVLLGMLIACDLSNKKKLLSTKDLLLIKNHYVNLGLFVSIKKYFKKNEINNVVNFMKKDKKNTSSNINLILLKKIGKTTRPNQIKYKIHAKKKFLYRYY